MSESENIPSISSEKPKKHVQTQHGNSQNADEENIVVLKKIFCVSPLRDNDAAVCWEEICEDDDVS